ncbi:unnamed protein product [Mytilus edulis]|uniref:Uncharacterized protein n=1 Tax=Mytilus edulis TaxID=6550 RepID=A0A8S3PPF7_MYTED|nr:unnamed protein product [Mytilus edulis]
MPRITFAATHSDKFSEDTLVDIAFQQSSWGQRMPIVWVPLDLQISDMRADGVKLITKEKLLEINKSNKEFALNERRVEDFLLVQHSIGKLLYFDEPALRDFIVIQPTAMVNILRAFITDRMFWPEKETIRDILENLSSTGVLSRKDVLTLWSQPAFEDILVNDRIKDYVMQVLVHLDILVEPKRYIKKDTTEYLYTRKDTASDLDTQTEKNTDADLFLVPCIWRDKTNSSEKPATFGKLQKALSAIDRQHYLCQINMIDTRKTNIKNCETSRVSLSVMKKRASVKSYINTLIE